MRTPQNTTLRQKLAALTLTLPLAFSAVAYADGPDVAIVDGIPISKARVDLLVKQRAKKGEKDGPDLRKTITEQLTMQLLVSQKAIQNSLDKSPEVVDQIELTQQSILANAFVQDYLKSHPVSDDTLKVAYDKVRVQMEHPKQAPPLDQVKPQLTQRVQQEQLKSLIDDMTAKAKIAVAAPGSLIVATVNGTPISKERIDLLVKQRMGTGQSDTPELRKAIIDQLAVQLLVSREAVKNGLDKNPEVADQIELARQSILANAFVQDYMKSHPAGGDKQVQQQQLKKVLDELKAKAKITILN